MKKSILFVLVVLFVLVIAGCTGTQKQVDEEDVENRVTSYYHSAGVTIATGGRSGTYFSFGSSMASILDRKTRIPFRVIPSHGSVENAELLSDEKAEFAFIQNDIADHAWKGISPFGKEIADFAAVAALYTETCHIVVNPNSGIRSISDLRGKIVAIGDYNSGTVVNAKQILEVYGLTTDDIQARYMDSGISVDALDNNRIDAFFCVGGAPIPAIARMAEGKDIAFLEIDSSHAEELIKNNPYYSEYIIPPETYKGQDTGIPTLALKAVLVASLKLPDDLVYVFTKNLFESKTELEAAHLVGSELDIDSARNQNVVTIPFHPGASRYYKEVTGHIIIQTPERKNAD